MSPREEALMVSAISNNTKCLDVMGKNIKQMVNMLSQQQKLIHELQRELAKYQVDRDMG